jgi:chromosome segregation ATPase
MANQRKVGLKIEIDGEREYKSAIAELNKGNQVLASELRKVQEQFEGNESSIEALNAKGDVLQRQLQQQKDKVQTLRDALKNAATEYGEADSRTQEWQIKLNNAETAQIKLERAIEENNKAIDQQEGAMEDAGKAASGLGDQVDELGGALGIRLPSMAKDALNSMEGFSAGTVASMGIAAAGIGSAVAVTKELYELTKQAAQAADELNTRSAQTGLSTDLLQQLDYAQKFLDFDGLDKSLQRLTQSMGSATNASSKQAAAFKDLGVEIYDEDGKLRSNYDVFLDVIDALGELDDKTRADIEANTLFGRSYAELKPLIEAGSGALKEYTDRAQEMGYAVDAEVIERLQRLNDALDENATAVDTAKTEVAGFFAPLFQSIIDGGTGAINVVRELFGNDIVQAMVEASNPLVNIIANWTHLAGAYYDVKDAGVEAASSSEETAARVATATSSMREAVDQLALKYQEALEAARTSLDGQFGLWQEASSETEQNIQAMIAAQESQAAYWDDYSRDFEDLQSRNIEGIDELAAKFDDGSKQSKDALEALSQASDEEIEKLIASMNKTEQAKSDLAQRFADLAVDVPAELKKIADEFDSTVQEINKDATEVDFAPFEESVNSAFSFLEERAGSSVSTVRGWLAELSAEIDAVEARAANVNVGHNAGGTDNWRGGLTYLAENGPELVDLPQGSRVHTAQETRQILGGGTDMRETEAKLDRAVTLLGQISTELSGLRVRGRMA